jgi:nucleotide-binding universal stress UspA family protein
MLDTVAAELERAGRKVRTEVGAGHAAQLLDEEARKHGADLIVAGSRRPSPDGHYLLGATAEKLIRHSHTSVLVVR